MAELLSPGLFITEVSSSVRSIVGVSTSTVGFVGTAQKGPISVPTFISSETEFNRIFGDILSTSHLGYAVQAFFKNGGARCYVVRIAHYLTITDRSTLTATKASYAVGNGILIVQAINEGDWGNNIQVKVERSSKVRTTLSETLSTGNLTAVLSNMTGIVPGTILTIPGALSETGDPIVVQSVAGHTVSFTTAVVVAGSTPVAPGVAVTSNHFDLSIYYKGILKEKFNFLTNSETDIKDFAESRINTFSSFITLTVGNFVTVVPNDLRTLEQGTNGLTSLADSDYVGSPSSNTGLYALDVIEDVPLIAIPGITTVAVHNGLITYAENRKDTFAVLETPENFTSTQSVEYTKSTGNFNSSYGAIYWPWVLTSDPITGMMIARPPSGYVLGRYAYTDITRQAGVAKAPAGISDGKLNSVLGLQTVPSQGDRDLVYPAKINPLASFPGDGNVIWGAQTLSSDTNFRLIQVRRLFIFVRSSLLKGMRFVVFENNDTKTRAAVRRTVTSFLLTLWRRGMLQGDKPESAFFVSCDEVNNPPSVVNQGRLVCDVGIAPQKATEFFEINLSVDQRALEEELAQAGA